MIQIKPINVKGTVHPEFFSVFERLLKVKYCAVELEGWERDILRETDIYEVD